MSNLNQNLQPQKQLVVVVSRYGQIIAVYHSLDDALIICKDFLVKGQPFEITAKFVQ